ncbi:unnamed protein product [Caretta caretta]
MALSLCALFKPPAEEGQPFDEKEFKASQDWLNSFSNRFNLKNVQTTGEPASANEEAAKAYPEKLKKIIEEKGYLLEQVFNADETGLFWKKMPTSKSEGQAPGFKAAKDHFTLGSGTQALALALTSLTPTFGVPTHSLRTSGNSIHTFSLLSVYRNIYFTLEALTK